MDEENEDNEYISLEVIPRGDPPPSPSADCPSEVTEDADLDNDLLTGDATNEGRSPKIGQESPSINLPRELDSSGGEEEGDSRGERVANPRIIAVSPQPGGGSPDIKSDYDSGVKIDNEDDDDDGNINIVNKTPDIDKPARTPSLVSCEADPSSRSVSPANSDRAASAKVPPKKAASQPPKFKNDVEPMEYKRQAPPVGYNRAAHSVQCKAMLVIMGASILAVIFVIGFIILNGGNEDLPETVPIQLEGIFNMTNRLYIAAYADSSTSDYQRQREEFIYTMNATFQSSKRLSDLYNTTAVEGIEPYSSITGVSIPVLNFTIYLVIPKGDLNGQDNVTEPPQEVTGSSLVSDPTSPVPGNDVIDDVIDDVIEYLVNVTDSGDFGNFTGQIRFSETL